MSSVFLLFNAFFVPLFSRLFAAMEFMVNTKTIFHSNCATAFTGEVFSWAPFHRTIGNEDLKIPGHLPLISGKNKQFWQNM